MTRLVVDSTSDLPAETMERLGITMVPLKVHFGQEEFLDRVELDGAGFFKRLEAASELPQTSQPSPGEFLEVYKRLPADEAVISLHIAEQLSGTVQSARLAAKELPDREIRVIDSGNATAALAVMALTAADMIAAGKSPDDIEKAMNEMRPRSRLVAILDTLKYAIMGGRVNRLEGTIGGLLRVKPLILVHLGEIHRMPPARTWSQAFQRVVDDIKDHGGAERISILDAQAPESRAALRAQLEKNFPGVEITEGALGAVIGTHGGPGAIGCGYIAKQA